MNELEKADEVSKSTETPCYACVANGEGDYNEKCWLETIPENCWIDNKPKQKEDCEYWEIVSPEELGT